MFLFLFFIFKYCHIVRINAIEQLCTELCRLLQHLYHEQVLPAFAPAMDDFLNPKVQVSCWYQYGHFVLLKMPSFVFLGILTKVVICDAKIFLHEHHVFDALCLLIIELESCEAIFLVF
jgi:hypothetical protein